MKKQFTKRFFAFLLVCGAPFTATVFAQNAVKQTKPVIVVFGTYHFDNPGRDLVNPEVDNVLTDKRQKEIVEFVALIKKYKPTRIAVEQPTTNAKLNERYTAYVNGKAGLTANEVDQIGFRLAKDLNHKQVYTVDWQGNFDIDRVIKAAAANNQTAITDGVINKFKSLGAKYDAMKKTATITEILRSMNEQKEIDETHRIYLSTIRVGGADDYAGADMARDWYERNLKIYANILRITESPTERVLVVIGASHVKLLQQFAAESGDFELESASKYLN